MAGPDQKHHLPLRPITDALGVTVDHGDETDLKSEPQQFDHDPEQEVRLEAHLTHDTVAPQGAIDFQVALHAVRLNCTSDNRGSPLRGYETPVPPVCQMNESEFG